MKNSKYFADFFLSLFKVSLATIFLIPLFVSISNSQPFLRQYKPIQQSHTNSGHCIIKADATDAQEYVTVGQYRASDANGNAVLYSGLVHWTNIGGALMDWKNIDEAAIDQRDHWLNFIDSNVVYGEKLVAGLPVSYTGYPATGYVERDFPDGNMQQTWTTLISPVAHTIPWNYYIVDPNINAKETIGMGVVWDRENPHDFIVLSAVHYFPNESGLVGRTFLVTKYYWNIGLNGHQVAWSFEYNIAEEDVNYLMPFGIVQGADNDVVIAGNMTQPIYSPLPPYLPTGTTTDSRIFTIKIDNATGNVVTPLREYVNNDNGSFVGRSITGPYADADLLISGFVVNNTTGYQKPLLMSIDQNLGVNPVNNRSAIYDCGTSAFLNCAKKLDQQNPPAPGPVTRSTRLVGVGSIVDNAGNNSDVLILNTNRLDGVGVNRDGAVRWATKQGSSFGQEGNHYCEARWFVPSPANSFTGQYMYTGISDGPGVTDKYLLGGAVSKINGTSDGSCSEALSPSKIIIDFEEVDHDVAKVAYGYHVLAAANVPEPPMDTISCTGSTAAKVTILNDNNVRMTTPVQDETTIQTSGEEINILYTSSQAGSVKIVLVDALGNAIVNNVFRCSTGLNSYKISTNNFTSGSYFVAIANGGYQFNKNILLVK